MQNLRLCSLVCGGALLLSPRAESPVPVPGGAVHAASVMTKSGIIYDVEFVQETDPTIPCDCGSDCPFKTASAAAVETGNTSF